MTNLNVNKKVLRETGDSHPPAEDELSLCGGSELDEQIDRLVDTTNSLKVNFANNDESEPEGSDEDDIASNFSAVEKTGPPIGEKLASVINNVMLNPVNRQKLVQKVKKHPRTENLNSLKIKKYNPEIIVKLNSSVNNQIQRSENTEDAGLRFKSSRSNLQSH